MTKTIDQITTGDETTHRWLKDVLKSLGHLQTATRKSHLYQAPRRHVTLVFTGSHGTQNEIATGLQLSNTTDGSMFEIPERQMLIVTDVDWAASHSAPYMQTLELRVVPLQIQKQLLGPGSHQESDFSVASHVRPVCMIPSGGGRPGASVAMVSGFAVESGETVWARVAPGGFAFGWHASNVDEDPPSSGIILHGYLIEAF